MRQAHTRTEYATSSDNVRICYQVLGEAPETLVLAPGLAASPRAYAPIVQHFRHRFRCVVWHARGTYGSGPVDAHRLRIDDHVADLEAIVQAEGLSHFVLGGWSIGVQICLEYAHRHPEQCRALVLINGSHGKLLQSRGKTLHRLARSSVRAGRRCPRLLGRTMRFASRHSRLLAPLLLRRGTLSSHVEAFAELAKDFSAQSMEVVVNTILRADEHSAMAYLPHLRLPVLVICGTHDPLVPQHVSEQLTAALPAARLARIEGATHYVLVELPERVNAAMQDFFDAL